MVPAPGARVVIRDAEWVVRRVDMTSDGAYQLVCDGISELVREHEAVYLSSLEEIEVPDPALTRLTPDRSPGFADSFLYMESQLRATVPNDESIHVGHQAAMDLVPYQLDPARQALARPRQRILIADAVGLGKALVIRRFKKDIRHQVREAFRDREVYRHRFPASTPEKRPTAPCSR